MPLGAKARGGLGIHFENWLKGEDEMTIRPSKPSRSEERNKRMTVIMAIFVLGAVAAFFLLPDRRDQLVPAAIVAWMTVLILWMFESIQDQAQDKAEKEGKKSRFNRNFFLIGLAIVVVFAGVGFLVPHLNFLIFVAGIVAVVFLFLLMYFFVDDLVDPKSKYRHPQTVLREQGMRLFHAVPEEEYNQVVNEDKTHLQQLRDANAKLKEKTDEADNLRSDLEAARKDLRDALTPDGVAKQLKRYEPANVPKPVYEQVLRLAPAEKKRELTNLELAKALEKRHLDAELASAITNVVMRNWNWFEKAFKDKGLISTDDQNLLKDDGEPLLDLDDDELGDGGKKMPDKEPKKGWHGLGGCFLRFMLIVLAILVLVMVGLTLDRADVIDLGIFPDGAQLRVESTQIPAPTATALSTHVPPTVAPTVDPCSVFTNAPQCQ